MSVSLQVWLLAQGFTANPFEIWQADEEALLSRYFVRPDIFDAVRSQSDAQQSVVLFAPRGHGKSALRQLIAYECTHDPRHPALVVELTNYDWVERDSSATSSRERYRTILTRLTTGRLWAQLARSPERVTALRAQPLLLVRLHALTHWSARRSSERPPLLTLSDEETARLADELRLGHSAEPEDLVQHLVEEYRGDRLVKTMQDLVVICQAVGYASLIYLVDRVDEDEITEGDWAAALSLIRPLFNLHLLEIRGLAFKFFLPDALASVMRANRVAMRLGNRPRRYDLTWSHEQLSTMLRLRLETFSRDPRGSATIRSFADLCDQVPDADTRLVTAATGSPRRLIRLARMVLDHHCNRAADADERIAAERFTAAITGGVSTLASEVAELATFETVTAFPSVPDLAPTSMPAALSAQTQDLPLLRLDDNGTIWLGDQRHCGEISRICRLILEQIWQRRSSYVQREALCEVLDIGEESLYKAVVRLRNQLEPELKNSKHYIEDITGIGYRLVNIASETSS